MVKLKLPGYYWICRVSYLLAAVARTVVLFKRLIGILKNCSFVLCEELLLKYEGVHLIRRKTVKKCAALDGKSLS